MYPRVQRSAYFKLIAAQITATHHKMTGEWRCTIGSRGLEKRPDPVRTGDIFMITRSPGVLGAISAFFGFTARRCSVSMAWVPEDGVPILLSVCLSQDRLVVTSQPVGSALAVPHDITFIPLHIYPSSSTNYYESSIEARRAFDAHANKRLPAVLTHHHDFSSTPSTFTCTPPNPHSASAAFIAMLYATLGVIWCPFGERERYSYQERQWFGKFRPSDFTPHSPAIPFNSRFHLGDPRAVSAAAP